jgi:thioredoxin-dependent peroxiredoxin
MSAPAPEIGDVAPDFTLPGIDQGVRGDYTLSEFRGRNVVLAFYPGDFTPGCTRQMCSYRDHMDEFEGVKAVLLGISPQDVDSHERWAEKRQLPFPLLADTEKEVIDAYGVGAPVLGVRRSVFVIDGEGVVRYKHVALIGATFRSASELAGVVAKL